MRSTLRMTLAAGLAWAGWCAAAQGGIGCGESNIFEVSPGQPGDVGGLVYDQLSGAPISGASVTVGDFQPVQTGPEGMFALTEVPAGPAALIVAKAGYYDVTDTVMIREDSATTINVVLTPHLLGGGPVVAQVTSKWVSPAKHAFFLAGVPLNQTFTATVEWDGHAPHEVRFITPVGTYLGSGSDQTWTRTMNVGAAIGAGGKLYVQAVADGGAVESPLYQVNLSVVSKPPGLPVDMLHPIQSGNWLKYGATMEFNITDEDDGVPAGTIPDNIPGFGDRAFNFLSQSKIAVEVTQDEVSLDASAAVTGPGLPKPAKIAGFEFKPKVGGALLWHSAGGGPWQPGGQFLVGADISAQTPPHYVVFFVGPIPVPAYWRMGFELSADAALLVQSWAGDGVPLINGMLTVNPYAEIMLGAGVADVLALEGYLGGGAIMMLQYPQQPTLEKLQIYLSGGIRIVVWIWKYEVPLLHYAWDVYGGRWVLVGESKATLRPLSRDYLYSPSGYAIFTANHGVKTYNDPVTVEMELQSNVFGYSAPALTAIGDDLLLVWIYDDPNRTPTNRTMLVSSRYDSVNEVWSPPVAVADDGTADFHPHVTVLPCGDVLLAWENVKEVLDEPDDPDDPDQLEAKMEELKSKTEIAVARYSAATGQWGPAQQLTDNLHLDRSPRISAAPNGMAMLTWASNAANDPIGDAANPNEVHAAFYDGSEWSQPTLVAANVPSIVKSDMAWNGSEGLFIFSADTDGDLATHDDRELFGIAYSGGGWQSVVQLTDDSAEPVEDANPRLAYDAAGHPVIVWYRGGRLMYATTADLSDQEVARDLDDSTGRADFALAAGASGQIGLVWQDTSEDRVDIWYTTFDPVVATWAAPQQLTADGSMEYGMSPVFDASGDLLAAYNKAQIEYETRFVEVNGELVQIDNVPIIGQVDLYLLRHTVSGDLAVFAEDVSITPANPLAGSQATIKALVRNLGDVPASDVVVAVYDGDPGAGGLLIDEAIIDGPLVGGETVFASVTWQVPPSSTPHDIYVVVDPDQQQVDRDRTNNTAIVSNVMLPDLTIESLIVQTAGPDKLLTARVLNAGVLPVMDVPVVLRQDDPETGQVLAAFAVQTLVPGAYEDVTFRWEDPPGSPSGERVVYAIVDELDIFLEFDEDNNVRSVRVAVAQPGACCYVDGSCAYLTASHCTATGGNWQGMGTVCDPNPCFRLGDLNCDGVIDGFDIQPFVLALTDPDAYAAAYPHCDYMLADINGDGVVDGFDIQPFVDLLVGG